MAMNIDATFEGIPTSAFKNDMRNLVNLPEHLRKSKDWD